MRADKLLIAILLVFISLCFVNNTWAEFEAKRFKNYKDIDIKDAVAGKNYRIVLDKEIFNESQASLNDLRIVANEQAELPFETFIFNEESKTVTLNLAVVKNEINSDKANMLVVDLNAPGNRNNRLNLEIAEYNFGRRVMVEGSDDGQKWQMLTKDIYIYDFTFGGDQTPRQGDIKWRRVVDERYMADFSYKTSSRNTTVSYKENKCRYLRLTVFGARDEGPLTIKKIDVFSFVNIPAEETEYKYFIAKNEINKEEKSSEITLDIGAKNIPISSLKIFSGSKNYYRSVYVQGGDDLENWADIGHGDIFNYDIENFKDTKNTVGFKEARFRYLKLIILNQDNPPIKVDAVTGKGLNRSIVFPYNEGSSLRIYYGNQFVKKPAYDYARFVTKIDSRKLKILAIGGQTANPVYIPEKEKKPWSEERPYLLWLAVIGIVVILLVLAASMMKKIKQVA